MNRSCCVCGKPLTIQVICEDGSDGWRPMDNEASLIHENTCLKEKVRVLEKNLYEVHNTTKESPANTKIEEWDYKYTGRRIKVLSGEHEGLYATVLKSMNHFLFVKFESDLPRYEPYWIVCLWYTPIEWIT